MTEQQAKRLTALMHVCVQEHLAYQRSKLRYTSTGRRDAAKHRKDRAEKEFDEYVKSLLS